MERDIQNRTHWYVEPIGSHTNQVIARRLAELDELAARTHQSIKDKQGQEHSVFEVPKYSFITELCKSAADLDLRFNVYNRALNYGPMNLWLFINKDRRGQKPVKTNQELKRLLKKKGVGRESKT